MRQAGDTECFIEDAAHVIRNWANDDSAEWTAHAAAKEIFDIYARALVSTSRQTSSISESISAIRSADEFINSRESILRVER